MPEISRRLTTILAADVAGYSRLAEADEEGTVSRLRALRHELIDPAIRPIAGVSSTPPEIAFSSSSPAWWTPCAARSMSSGQ